MPCGFAIRTYWPAGIIHVKITANKIMLKTITNVCGILKGFLALTTFSILQPPKFLLCLVSITYQ